MAKKHEVNEAAGITPEIAAELDRQLEEAANDQVFDESAAPKFHQPDVSGPGTYGGSFGKVVGVTTSPKIVKHDVPQEQLHARFNDLDSSDVEALLEVCYGKSVYKASVENFETFDRSKLEEILSMSQAEVEALLGTNLFSDEVGEADDYSEEQNERSEDG